MAAEEVGESCQHEAPRHPLGQRVAERELQVEPLRHVGPAPLVGRDPLPGPLPPTCGDHVDAEIRVRFDEIEEPAVGGRHLRNGLGGDLHALALPGNPPVGIESDVVAGT